MIGELLTNLKSDKKDELRNRIYERMMSCKEDLEFVLKSNQNKKNISLIAAYKDRNR